ncbi:MAG TPA: signal recognition particle receptor subunit alpha [Nitrososphaerales archaeon]|jgi:signal recognition particle subunit SRP54|nr:signal recognition particle receptor subunit alpha [Nitrososphaerales archaeon]|tara:strand:+ start:3694 stop:5013 length:1320 start_codon:yes stop_codon:yes gene_type:complete
MLSGLQGGLRNAVKKLVGGGTVDEAAVKEFVKDLQRALLQADVNVKLVLALSTKIEQRALDEKLPPGLPRKDHIVKILYEELSRILGEETEFKLSHDKTSIILLAGIQGSGKTTITAKLARNLSKQGHKVGVVGADTFRPGALVQLKMLCEKIKVPVYGKENAKDSVKIASEGVKHFKTTDNNIIIIDTAGRHKEEAGLLKEMQDLNHLNPDKVLLVIDGTIGQQCYSQAEAFHKIAPIGGIVITKLDGAAKGGGALAAAAATGAKIVFIGTGERVDDLEVFSPSRFVGRLLDMGDLKALLDRVKDLEIEADTKKLQRITSGKMTIDDLYYQIEQMKKMGSLKKILDLVPGFSSAMKDQDLDKLEDKMQHWRIIIQSMTRTERQNPDLLNSSRIHRIAKGSGTPEKEIKEMMSKYKQTKSVMKASRGRQFRQMMKRMQQ